jgi:hypothetical protein
MTNTRGTLASMGLKRYINTYYPSPDPELTPYEAFETTWTSASLTRGERLRKLANDFHRTETSILRWARLYEEEKVGDAQ